MTADILVAILSFILLDYNDLDMKFWTSIVIQFTWKILMLIRTQFHLRFHLF